jgi:RNA polymerase sigma factor (sigma-70 family)
VITKTGRTLQRELATLFAHGAVRELTDGQLLERFATGEADVAEHAFAALVERHGPMVLRVCRAQAGDNHESQDAFQATFLILIQKARRLWVKDSLGPWLHQVAFRTASCARTMSARRRRLEREIVARRAEQSATPDLADVERERLLHEEINRLPDRYRIPIVLCDLEGQSCEEAARRMGRPIGTVKSWRARGRERLRLRLIRSGLLPTAVLTIPLTSELAAAGHVLCRAQELLRIAGRALTGRTMAGVVPAPTHALTKGVTRAMLVTKLRAAACLLISLAVLTAGFTATARALASRVDDGPQSPQPEPTETTAKVLAASRPVPTSIEGERWPLTLREAFRIGLENARELRIVSFSERGATIAPRAEDFDDAEFRAQVMAKLRAIEQCYWTLTQAHAQLRAYEDAVAHVRTILKNARSALAAGRLPVADVAEAEQRLEQCCLDLTMKASDVISTERQLHEALGVPLVVNRRIIPITAPTEGRVEPDWDVSLRLMNENQPDLVRAKLLLIQAEGAFAAADRPEPANESADTRSQRLARISDLARERNHAREWRDEVSHATTHSLARFFLEVDANFKQFKTASRLRAAANQRMEAQAAFYKEGRIPIDRYLDAVNQYFTSIAVEAQFRTTYNISIMALEEAKGTLLDHDQITIAAVARTLPLRRTKSFLRTEANINSASPVAIGPAPPTATAAAPAERRTDASVQPAAAIDAPGSAKTISFRFTIGTGPKPIEIRGSFTVSPSPSQPSAPPIGRTP